jgi:heterotetrameric sarcosine oxidase gamma subunit
MHDMTVNQVPYVDWQVASLRSDRIAVRRVPDLTQHMVSGALSVFAAKHGIGEPVGLLGHAAGPRYAARMARDRMIAVGVTDTELQIGWNPEGYAVTRMSSASQVFELRGPGAMDLIMRGCPVDPDDPGPSSSVLFAGLPVSLYRHDDLQTFRLHVDRGLAHFLWSWMSAQSVFATG